MHRTLRVGIAAAALTLIPVATAAAAPYASRTLDKGTSGGDVESLQGYLDDAGYDTTADGEFGPATARSVRSFEAAEQRSVDGRATPADQRLVQTRAGETEPQTPAAQDTEEAYVDDSGLAVAPASAPE
ncbi:MAG: putative peptidoglycan binding domain, partial [Thermoleophilaceae bacterium]|nr:putative peptidoglycan binding domain [Thermoleophilaceae bacterium]